VVLFGGWFHTFGCVSLFFVYLLNRFMMKLFYLSFVFCLYEIPTIAIMDEMGCIESCGLYYMPSTYNKHRLA